MEGNVIGADDPSVVLHSSVGHDDARVPETRTVESVKQASTSQNILLFLVAFRIINALSVRTFFQPDEYFQSLEPAWEIAFGADSGAWITWVRIKLAWSAIEADFWRRNGKTNLDRPYIQRSSPSLITLLRALPGYCDCLLTTAPTFWSLRPKLSKQLLLRWVTTIRGSWESLYSAWRPTKHGQPYVVLAC